MNRYNAIDRLLLVILIVVVIYAWSMAHYARQAALTAPSPGIHVQADIPLHQPRPDAGHILSGQPDPDDAPSPEASAHSSPSSERVLNTVPPLIGYAPIPVVSWVWTEPTETDRAIGTTCAQEGTSAGGQVVSARSWPPRRDGLCYVEDATK